MTNRRPGATLLQRDRALDRNDADAVEAALAASGDAHAFERLYRTHVGRVYALVRRMLDDEDADEVTQDIFVRAWQKLATYRGEAAFSTWLHRVGVNVILARRQMLGTRRNRFLEGDEVLDAVPSRRSGPETALDFEAALARRSQRLEVNAHAGEVVVRTWNRNAVRVRAELRSGARLAVDRSSAAVNVRTSGERGEPANYNITVPAWMAVDLQGVNTTMTVEGVQAAIRAETVNGDISVKGGAGLVSLNTVEGSVTLEGAKGRIDVQSVNADVTVRNVEGEVRAETVNGGVTLTGVRSESIEATTVNGDLLYDGTIRPGGRYRLVTHNGDVTITVPVGTDARVSVSTFQGDFESDFPVTLTERRGKRFDFTLGSGSGAIDLESFQGTIRLVRPGARAGRGDDDDE